MSGLKNSFKIIKVANNGNIQICMSIRDVPSSYINRYEEAAAKILPNIIKNLLMLFSVTINWTILYKANNTPPPRDLAKIKIVSGICSKLYIKNNTASQKAGLDMIEFLQMQNPQKICSLQKNIRSINDIV